MNRFSNFLNLCSFFQPEPLRVEYIECVEIPWEIYRGRLLDETQTRLTKTMRVERLLGSQPLLELLFDFDSGEWHVVRLLLCHVWTPYESSPNVIETKQTPRLVRELIGTISDASNLQIELPFLLRQAVLGASRLPLASLEAPHPLFSLGRWSYLESAREGACIHDPIEWLRRGFERNRSLSERAHALELALRTSAEIGDLHDVWNQANREPAQLVEICKTMVNGVSLTPYTSFVPRFLAFVRVLPSHEYGGLLACILRRLARHVTAYDLVTFHHRGANYPDALFVDLLLRDYLEWCLSNTSQLATDPLQRRALRRGWITWKLLEGLPVPIRPTSPGENVRILPEEFAAVSDAEILDPRMRTSRLYQDNPLPIDASTLQLIQSVLMDLSDPREFIELGTGIFLDRPLGLGKLLGEPDLTVLFSHVASSESLANHIASRIREWGMKIPDIACTRNSGLPVIDHVQVPRPGVVSLSDAQRVAPDFMVIRTTELTKAALCRHLDQDVPTCTVLPDSGNPSILHWRDADRKIIATLQYDPDAGYISSRGEQFPRSYSFERTS